MAIANRYEFMYFVECVNGNPNGDPDAGNSPRIDPQDMHGLISDVAVKRRIRNYVTAAKGNEAPYGIIIQQSTNINRFIALAHEESGSQDAVGKTKTQAARAWVCANYFDVRAFGAVLSTGENAGQVRGPVQLAFLRSHDPVLPLDMSITRMAVAENIKGGSSTDYEAWEAKQPEDKMRTMGRKQFIPYGLYEGRGFISANLAGDTGFGDSDLALLWDALLGMYEHDRSASKGMMSTIAPVIVFRHVGTDTDALQRQKQAKLGCAPAHKLFDLVKVEARQDVELPRSYRDYVLRVSLSKVPPGVEIGFACPGPAGSTLTWGGVPEGNDWIALE